MSKPISVPLNIGLWTESGAIASPPGAMSAASNVMLNRTGTISPRPGFGVASEIATRSTAFRPVKLFELGSDTIISAYDSSGPTYRIERGTVATTYVSGDASSGAAPPSSRAEIDGFGARASVYLTTYTGLRKLTGAAASIADAGLPTLYLPLPIASGTGTTCAYRYCWVSTDANGYIRRSAPSSRFLALTGGAVRFDRVYLPTWAAAGDRLEIYRTPNAVSSGTEYQLAVTHVITSAQASAGYIAEDTLSDNTTDADLGAFLYTNPSQGGIASANEIPPRANVCAWWNDCAWLGNTLDRARLPIEIQTDDSLTGVGAQDITTAAFTSGSTDVSGIGSVTRLRGGQGISDNILGPTQAGTYVAAGTSIARIFTDVTINNGALVADVSTFTLFGVTWTWRAAAALETDITIGANSAASATNMASKISGLATTTWPYDVVVTASANATVVTIEETGSNYGTQSSTNTAAAMAIVYRVRMTAQAIGTTGSVTAYAGDTLVINGTTFWWWSQGGARLNRNSASAVVTNPTYRLIGWSSSPAAKATALSEAMAAYTRLTSAAHSTYGLVDASQPIAGVVSPATVTLQRGEAYRGAITASSNRGIAYRPSLANTVTSDSTTFGNRVHYSKPSEPEAWPLLNNLSIGSQTESILRFVALREALLIFTTRGLYRVTGTAPHSWVVECVDETLRLLHAECVCVMRDVCYAWTDRGIVPVTVEGVGLPISQQIGATIRDAALLLPYGATTTDRGFYMFAHERLGLVVLGVASAVSDVQSTTWYVWHQHPGAWSTWLRTDRCAIYHRARAGVRTGSGLAHWAVMSEHAETETVASRRYDHTASGSASWTGGVLTIAQSVLSPFVPVVGDTIELPSGDVVFVGAVNTSGANYLLTIFTVGPTAFTAYTTASSGTAIWYQSFIVYIEWTAIRGTSLAQDTHWQEAHVALDVTSALASYMYLLVGGAVHHDPSPQTGTVFPASASRKLMRLGISREVARSPWFAPTFSTRQGASTFTLSGLTLIARPYGSHRVTR